MWILKHLFNDVQSSRKNEYAFLWGYKSIVGLMKVLMDFNEIKVACILFIYDDSKVECIIPSKAERALCIIFVQGPLMLAHFIVFIELYSDVSVKLCNSYAVWLLNVYWAFCQVFYKLLWPTTSQGPASPNGSVFKCRTDGFNDVFYMLYNGKVSPSHSLKCFLCSK